MLRIPSHLILFFRALGALYAVAVAEKAFFALYHRDLFTGLSTWQEAGAILWGYRFDLAVCAVLATVAYVCAYLLHRLLRVRFATALRRCTYPAVVFLIILHGADLLYYQEAGRHLGYELGEWYNSGTALVTAALASYTLPVALQFLFMVPALWLIRRLVASTDAPAVAPRGLRHRLKPELQLGAVLIIGGLLARGGIQSVPLEPLHAQAIGDSARASLALNGAYNALFSSVTRYSIKPVLAAAPSPEQLALVRAMYPARPDTAAHPAAPYNVVVVLLESWSAAYMGSYGFDKDTTPNFDRLRTRALTTRGMLAGGHRTTEGMFATFCSAQNPLGETVAQSQLQNYDYRCLPHLLGDRGYHTAFFQGTLEGTSGTGTFARLLGFGDSYGMEDIRQVSFSKNSWGVHDPDLYRFVLEKMHAMPQPFLVGINSNSTHDHRLPDGVQGAFPGGDPVHDYVNVLHFADQALMDFVTAVEQDKAFANTIFVLVADHTGMTPGQNFDRFSVPFLVYAPGLVKPAFVDRIASQRDIAPTVEALLGEQPTPWFTGKSLLGGSPPFFADYYLEGLLGWVEGRDLVEIPVRGTHAPRCKRFNEAGLGRRSAACDADTDARVQRALAFTQVAQNLLFTGRLTAFAQDIGRGATAYAHSGNPVKK